MKLDKLSDRETRDRQHHPLRFIYYRGSDLSLVSLDGMEGFQISEVVGTPSRIISDGA